MDAAEFNEWLEHHTAFNPGIRTWLDKQKNKHDILRAWAGILSTVHLQDAKIASEQLYGQEKQPQAYERHAASIKSIAKEQRAEQAEAQSAYARYGQTYRCSDCRDTGFCSVTVFGSIHTKATAQVGDEKVRRLNQSVVCNCESGDRITELRKKSQGKEIIRFDPVTMTNRSRLVQSSPATKQDWEQFRVAAHGIGQPEAVEPIATGASTERDARSFYGPGSDG